MSILNTKILKQVQRKLEDVGIDAQDHKELIDIALGESLEPVVNNAVVQTDIENKLDAKEAEYAPQLTRVKKQQQKTIYEMNREVIGITDRKPMISFVDDDCRSQIMTKWKPILEEKQVPVNFSVITNAVGGLGYATWEELKELQSLGAKFASHSHTHASLTELTASEIDEECRISKEILIEQGLDSDFLVYPYGSDNELVRKITRKYYRGAVDIQSETVNIPPVETYRLQRWPLQNNTLPNYLAKINETISANGWLIFMSHSQYEDFNETQLQYVREIIDYCNANGVEIVSLQDGYTAIGNIIDTGDYTARATGAEYTILDADGKLHSRTNNVFFKLSNEIPTPSTPITDFEVNKVTHNILQTANAVGFPENRAGTLQTYRYANDSYAYQIYQIFDDNRQYKRTWQNGGTWRSWDLMLTQTDFDNQRQYIVEPMNSRAASVSINDYPTDKTVVFCINSSGAAGYPATSGIVETFKGANVNWNRQIFKRYQSNEVWSRYADTSRVWTDWVKIST